MNFKMGIVSYSMMASFILATFSFVPTTAVAEEGASKDKYERKFDFHKESLEMRRSHIEEARKKHLELINKMYDLKTTQLNELEELGKKAEEAKTPDERKALFKQMKEKHGEHRKAIKEYREKTIKKEMKALKEEFHDKMKSRREEHKKGKN